MKRLLIFFVLLLFPLGFADQHKPAIPSEESPSFEEVDFTNPDQVNALPPGDLAMAIHQGQLTDLTVIGNEQLAELVAHGDPTADIDGARLFQQEGSLLFAEVEERGKCLDDCSESFLNSYGEVKKAWFAHFGIDDQRAEIRSYDGTILTTEGDHSTQFNPRQIHDYLSKRSLQAAVLNTGNLVIGKNTNIHQEEAFVFGQRDPTHIEIVGETLVVTNGIIEMDRAQIPSRVHFVVKPGSSVVVSGTTFESAHDFQVVTSAGNIYTVSGIGVKGTYKSPTTGNIPFVFTGSFEHRWFSGTDTAFLLGGSTLNEYRSEKSDHQERLVPFFTLQVSESIQLFSGCLHTNPHSCLSESQQPDGLLVVARDNNQIVLTTTPKVRFLNVASITDESQVTVSLGGRGIRIQQNGDVRPYGSSDLRQLPQVRAFSDGDTFTLFNRGKISTCTTTVCQEIASAQGAGRKGNIVHVAASRLDGQQAVMGAARRNGLAFTGYEAANIDFQNVQEDLATAETIAISGHHNPGKLSLWGEGGGVNIGNLPSSQTVKAVTFSACNTIKDLTDTKYAADPVLETLNGKYPDLRVVVGYNTKAPLYDGHVWQQLTPMVQRAIEANRFDELKRFVSQPQTGVVGIGKEGSQKLGLYVRENDQWKFCAAGEGCKAITPVVAAVISAEGESS